MLNRHDRWIFLLFTFLLKTPSSNSKLTPHPQYPCQPPHHNSYPFCNTSLPIAARAQSLISLLSLPEKIRQLSNNFSGVPRLGIPPYEWWSESLHGIATNGPGVTFNGSIPAATSFPQVILTASAFNRTLWHAIGAAIAVEARAMYNAGQAGLTFFAPNINIFRDPRWGRGQETPGEDPMVASAYAIEFVRGCQGYNRIDDGGNGGRFHGKRKALIGDGGRDDEDGQLMLSACCKHVTAYDLESWKNFSRYSFNAVVTEQDMIDTYQAPFRSCVEKGKASCLMCSYNAINGIPACAHRDLLQTARTEWDFKGYITSDCDAVATIFEYQNYTKSPEDAVSVALKAGTDINCGTYMLRHTKSAIEKGKLKEQDIDKAIFNLFSVQLRLGLFDGDPKFGRFGELGPKDVCTKEHRNLAREAARQGIVLLKNDGNFLPLSKNAVSSLAVVGPLANDTSKLGGGYTGIPCNPTSIANALQRYVKRVKYAAGCQDVPCNSNSGFLEAISIAGEAQFVIVVGGLDLTQETEDHDRYSLLLPGFQTALITTLAAVARKPLILVLTGGGPVDVSFAQGDSRIASIIWIGYPGEVGSEALAEIIFGDHNPGGRLPVTWYYESYTRIPMNDMNMRSNLSRGYPGRTYRFYAGDRIYGFAQGLSYTNYVFEFISAPNKINLLGCTETGKGNNILQQRGGPLNFLEISDVECCDSLRFGVQVSVRNEGGVDGSQAVLLFSRVPKSFTGAPEKQLVGFDRVHTAARGYAETNIWVDPCKHLSVVDEQGKSILPLGDHVLLLEDVEHVVLIAI